MKVDEQIDELFRLPLAEFTGARNVLAARLKKEGRQNDAERVKLLTKPSVSAWAVNQLYWDYREEFDELIATGKRFRSAPSSRAGKAANLRDSLDARREALVQLSDLATELLQEAGHSPTLDTLRRVTQTLEALSTYALLGDGPTPGRLTQDVDPPSFESLASLISGARGAPHEAAGAPSRKSAAAATSTKVKATSTDAARRSTEQARKLHQEKIAAAKVTLQDAKKTLVEARATAQSLEAAQKRASAEVKEAEKYRREAETILQRANASVEAATHRAKSVAAEADEAAQAIEQAKRTVEETTKELESLLRESPVR